MGLDWYARMNSESKVLSKILALYTKWGANDYIGEHVTQIEHALQCADLAAQDARLMCYDYYIRNCVIVAALLHDIGHLVGLEDGDMEMRGDADKAGSASLGIVGHEGIGAAFLKDLGMPRLVCELVQGHVAAKRYLCTTRPGYWESISPASQETMKLQGGMMSNDDIREFKAGFMPELKVFIREYDDGGKKNNVSSSIYGVIGNTIETGIARYKSEIENALIHGRLFV